jgi:hypothetical protein
MRNRKRTLLLAGLSSLLTVGIFVGLFVMVKHVPAFYHRADVVAGKGRQDLSSAFVGTFFRLAGNWADGRGDWEVAFTEAQINSYFEEDFIRLGDAEPLRKQGISDPRLVVENDRLRLAFRYGSDPWSAIVSYDLKVWLAPKEVNVVCIEILGRHVGALPLSTQSLLNEISEVAGRKGVEITWYRHEGNPVALIRFHADRARTPAQLRRLDVKQGQISIGGVSLEPKLTNNLKKILTPIGN